MDSMIKDEPWDKAKEAQANAQHRTRWCWQPTPVHLPQMLCMRTCPSPIAWREVPGKDWPNRKGEDGGGQTPCPAQAGFLLAQTLDLWH